MIRKSANDSLRTAWVKGLEFENSEATKYVDVSLVEIVESGHTHDPGIGKLTKVPEKYLKAAFIF